MIFIFSVASHHLPGERSVEIYGGDYGRRRLVNGKAFRFAFLFSFILMLSAAAFFRHFDR